MDIRKDRHMPKASFTGVVVFRHVVFGVRGYNAARDRGIALHRVHRTCMTPVHEQRYCTHCNSVLPSEECAHVVEHEGKLIEFNQDDLDSIFVKSEEDKPIRVIGTIPIAKLDTSGIETVYYLLPADDGAQYPYTVIAKALYTEQMGAIVQYISYKREHIGYITGRRDSGLLLTKLYYGEYVSNLAIYNPELDRLPTRAPDVELARRLVRSARRRTLDPNEIDDPVRQRFEQLLQTKLHGAPRPKPATIDMAPSKVVLVEALQASLRKQGKPITPKATEAAKRSVKRRKMAS